MRRGPIYLGNAINAPAVTNVLDGSYADIIASGAHVEAMKSKTAKLPKGQSYPLKPSKLEEALASANVLIDVYLTRTPGRNFRAYFSPPDAHVPHERLYIQAGSVLSEAASDARSEMDDKALPALAKWIAEILAHDPRSPVRREKHDLKFY